MPTSVTIPRGPGMDGKGETPAVVDAEAGTDELQMSLPELRCEVTRLRKDLQGVRATITEELRRRNVHMDVSGAGLLGAVKRLCEELSTREREAEQLRSELMRRSCPSPFGP